MSRTSAITGHGVPADIRCLQPALASSTFEDFRFLLKPAQTKLPESKIIFLLKEILILLFSNKCKIPLTVVFPGDGADAGKANVAAAGFNPSSLN